MRLPPYRGVTLATREIALQALLQKSSISILAGRTFTMLVGLPVTCPLCHLHSTFLGLPLTAPELGRIFLAVCSQDVTWVNPYIGISFFTVSAGQQVCVNAASLLMGMAVMTMALSALWDLQVAH